MSINEAFCVSVLMNASFHPPFVRLLVFVGVMVLNMGPFIAAQTHLYAQTDEGL